MKAVAPQAKTSAWAIYRAIVGVGALCGLLIVTVYQTTAGRIQQNQERFLAEAVSEVLPAAKLTLAVSINDDGQLEEVAEPPALPVFLGYDDAGNLSGAVLTAIGMGYADNIRVLYAYSFELDAITGFKILDSKETPGLGDKVEIEPHFIANFEKLDATLNTAGDSLMHPIITVKQGEKVNPWEIDGITGATITSVAIGDILRNSASTWVPVLERDAQDFATIDTNKEPADAR